MASTTSNIIRSLVIKRTGAARVEAERHRHADPAHGQPALRGRPV